MISIRGNNFVDDLGDVEVWYHSSEWEWKAEGKYFQCRIKWPDGSRCTKTDQGLYGLSTSMCVRMVNK